MSRAFLAAALLLGGISLLRAGPVITLASGSESDGKLSVVGAGLHVEGNSATPDINLTDILEASMGEGPFELRFVDLTKANQLPSTWKTQDIGEVGGPGSITLSDGTLKMTGGGSGTAKKPRKLPNSDDLFFAGQQWIGDGEWTARLKELDPNVKEASGGLMLRDSLDPGAPMCALAPTTLSVIRLPLRAEVGRDAWGTSTPGDPPVWLRLTRYLNRIYSSVSSNGTDFNIVADASFKTMANPWIGLFATSHKDGVLANIVFDQVTLTPPPSTAQILPPGVLLQSGTLLAGAFSHIAFDPASSDTNGRFAFQGTEMEISRALIAAVVMLPIQRSQITDMGAKTGILMRNGDLMDGELTTISAADVSVSSVLLGVTPYKRTEIRACFVHPLQVQPGAFEVRLRDGSIINASAISGVASSLVITDVSGLTIQADQDEVAQIRAGTAQVQTLAQLDWKATPPPTPAATSSTPPTNAAPATNAAPPDIPPLDANGNPIVIAPPEPPPLVQNWMGENQEQIMETGMQTSIEFPLPGKFRAMGVQIALSPDSPPNSTATIRILADGREIARTPPFRAGDQPRFMEVTFHDPSHVTLVAESADAGAKVLYIDPLAIRE